MTKSRDTADILEDVKVDGNVTAVGQETLKDNTGTHNTGVGYRAMFNSSMSGASNVALGNYNLYSNTSGANNTALGYQSLFLNTTASNNTAVGYQSLYENTTGSENVAVGQAALDANTTGSSNTALGRASLSAATTANANTAVGESAMRFSTTGAFNTAVGSSSLDANTTGSYNTAIGQNSLTANTTASQNTASGYQAGYNNSTGAEHAFFGFESGHKNTTGNYNTFIGRRAGYSTTTGSDNTIVGNGAGFSHTTGSGNGFFGTGAGNAVTTGSKNTIIGRFNGNQNGLDIRTRSNHIVLSDGDGNPRQVVTATGNIGMGTHSTVLNIDNSILMTLTGNGTHSDHHWRFGPHYTSDSPSMYCINENGAGVYLPHGNTSWSSHSDERIKENITSLESVLTNITNIRCVKYNIKGQSDTKIGFIAQDWEDNFSEVVDENLDQVIESDGTLSSADNSESTAGVKSISYTETIPVLLKAIQEQNALIETLTARVATLEG